MLAAERQLCSGTVYSLMRSAAPLVATEVTATLPFACFTLLRNLDSVQAYQKNTIRTTSFSRSVKLESVQSHLSPTEQWRLSQRLPVQEECIPAESLV